MKKIIFVLSTLHFICTAAFAQRAECDKCLPSKVYLSDAITKAVDLGSEEKNNAFAAVLKAAYNYLVKEDPARSCMIITNKGSVAKSPYSVVAYINGTGGNTTLELNLLSQCDVKKIATSEVPINLAGDADALKAAGEKAAKQLMPLEEKIVLHALNLRERDTRYMFNGAAANMEIRLKDPNVAIGKETEMYVRMTDCDGYPLKNRTVCFTPENMKDRQIPGVVGGVVTPSCGKTDGEGKLKVRFKRTAKSAMICGHYKGFNPSGCEDAVVGVAHVGDMPVKIVLNYRYYHDADASAREGGINEFTAMEEQTCNITCYYFPARPLQEKFSISLPLKGNQPGGKLEYLKEEGGYNCVTTATGGAAPLVFGNLDVSNNARRFSGSIDRKNHTSVQIVWAGRNVDNSTTNDEFLSLPQSPSFHHGVYSGSKVKIVFAYTPDEEAPAATEDIFVPLPGDKSKPSAGKKQMLNNPTKDIYFDENTDDAYLLETKLSKEEDPFYKKVIKFGMLTDRQIPSNKIMGQNVNLVLGDALLEFCQVEVYIPR